MKISKFTRIIFPLSTVIFFHGCALITQPIVEDSVGSNREYAIGKYTQGIGTLAATSDRRMVIIDLNNSKFCAEPEPITSNNITAELKATIEAVSGDKNAAIEIANTFNTISKQLFTPSQGLRFAQVQQYNLCQARRNGDLNQNDFNSTFNTILDYSKNIIVSENNVTLEQIKLDLKKINKSEEVLKLKQEKTKLKTSLDSNQSKIKKLNIELENYKQCQGITLQLDNNKTCTVDENGTLILKDKKLKN